MATPINFPQANTVFIGGNSPDYEICDLYAWSEGPHNVSVWKLSPEEIQEINETGLLALDVLCGRMAPPPVFVGSVSTLKDLIYGAVQSETVDPQDVAEMSQGSTPQAGGVSSPEDSASPAEVRDADPQSGGSPSAQDIPEEIL